MAGDVLSNLRVNKSDCQCCLFLSTVSRHVVGGTCPIVGAPVGQRDLPDVSGMVL